MVKLLLSDLSPEAEQTFKKSVQLYHEASRIEKLLVLNNAVPREDYTYLDLFKLAIEKLKADELENIGMQISKIEYQIYERNEIEKRENKRKLQ